MDALEQLKEAAKNNHAGSQFQLAVKYLEGVELQRDFDEAALWLRRSAEQGHAQAQIELGKLYVAGKGVEQDYVEAYKWVEMASIQRLMEIESLRKLKDADSCCEASRNELTLNNLSEFKRWMALRMTVDQITDGQQRAIQFLTMMRGQHGPDNPGESQQP